MIPVFDGHNDFLLRLADAPNGRDAIWTQGEATGHISLPQMRAGGMMGGFFAIFVPSPDHLVPKNIDEVMTGDSFDIPLPPMMSLAEAQPIALAMAGHLHALARSGTLNICTTAAEIEACKGTDTIAAVMHMEGAEALDPDLDALHLFHSLGLRSLGPVWSRPTAFGHGVPFRFPGSPDTGPGLTEAGKRLVAECNALRIMIDLSHLNAKGLEDVARISDAPLVATHSNAHAITPSTRNLTDRQLAMIAETGGMVGLNFATVFLRADGQQNADTGWDPILRHLDHLITHLGEDHVGFGSDFDGATVPNVIGDAGGMQGMIDALRDHGYDEPLLAKLAHQNWIDTCRRTWGG